MALKLTKNTQQKLRSLYEEIGFSVRFEKGNFKSGYCLIKDSRVAIINKFLPLEGRIQSMLDILPQIEVDVEQLSDEGEKFYTEIMSAKAE